MPETYVVQSGDSLWKIAVKYKVGVSELIAANPQISNPSLIMPGQKINIPGRDTTADSFEKQVVDLVNKERTSRGLKPLTMNWELARVARTKSEDMERNRYFSHQSPTYGSPFDMMKKFGIKYSSAAENIANGQTSAQAVVDAWMNSPGHRANILNGDLTQIGVGYANNKGTPYWTQMFIRP